MVENVEGQEEKGIEGSPGDEGPVGTVPESADDEYDEDISDGHALRSAASAKGDIEVIAKPGREAYMPAAPEFGNVAGEVWVGEVLHEVESKEARCSDGYIGVAGEVAVDLKSEEYGSHGEGAGGVGVGVAEDGVHESGAVIGDDHLFEEAPKDLTHSIDGEGIGEFSLYSKLRQEVCCTLNGAGNELWEEAYKSGEGYKVGCGLQLVAVHIDGVAQGLESVEANSYGEDNVEVSEIDISTEEGEGFLEIVYEEVVVLEKTEHAEVGEDA